MELFNIVMLVILAVLIFVMFRNSRKRKAQQEEMRSKFVPGVEVMTNFGLFGKILSIDEATNQTELELSPGVIVKVHRQTIAKLVEESAAATGDEPKSVEEAMERANAEYEAKLAAEKAEGEPEFGERVTDEAEKPAGSSTKKASE